MKASVSFPGCNQMDRTCFDWLPELVGRMGSPYPLPPPPTSWVAQRQETPEGVLPVSPEEDHQNLPSERTEQGELRGPFPTPQQTKLFKPRS